jgi:23S rRNA (uracil1939-C5)-methyltransferase
MLERRVYHASPTLAARGRAGNHAAVPREDAVLSLDVERLTFGPDALAHADGQVVFVPLAAPGDAVRARIDRRARGYLRADLIDVVRPGPDRVAPPCPAFGRCGGCQWQHVDLEAQRRAKQAIVAEQLARLGGLRGADVRPVLAPPAGLAYRARITLHVEGRRLGYQQRASHVLEEVAGCPIAAPDVERHIPIARRWVEALRTPPTRVTIAAAPGGAVLVAAVPAPPGPRDVDATAALLVTHASVRGAVLVHRLDRVVVGDPTVRLELEPGLAIEAPADAFAQVNPEANRLLVQTVLALGDFPAGAHVLDLYCGTGNFALPLARRGVRVLGIERDRLAVEAARANAARLGLAARFVAGTVAGELVRVHEAADGVVLDPPRAGAADAVDALVARAPRRIVYVSCDPATLARDLGRLASRGYAVRVVQPIDVFPQTFHVETVASIELT